MGRGVSSRDRPAVNGRRSCAVPSRATATLPAMEHSFPHRPRAMADGSTPLETGGERPRPAPAASPGIADAVPSHGVLARESTILAGVEINRHLFLPGETVDPPIRGHLVNLHLGRRRGS